MCYISGCEPFLGGQSCRETQIHQRLTHIVWISTQRIMNTSITQTLLAGGWQVFDGAVWA